MASWEVLQQQSRAATAGEGHALAVTCLPSRRLRSVSDQSVWDLWYTDRFYLFSCQGRATNCHTHPFITRSLVPPPFMWPCIVTNYFVIKPTSCTNFAYLFLVGSGWNLQFHPDPAWKLSTNLYDIYHCWVYSEWTPDDGQTNCPKHVQFHAKSKFAKLVHLVGHIKEHSLLFHQWLLVTDKFWWDLGFTSGVVEDSDVGCDAV